MKYSLYLHREIVDTLRMFGNLGDVVNKIVDAGMDGYYDVINKPPCPPRDGASRYIIDIYNEDYLQIMRSYPANSPISSPSRLIYWFVENQMYDELGWKPTSTYKNRRKEAILNALDISLKKLINVEREVYDEQKESVNTAIEAVQHCIKEVRNGI